MEAFGTGSPDRRRHQRVSRYREQAVLFYTDEHGRVVSVRGRLENISGCGAALLIKSPPAPDTIGELRVQFSGFQLVSECRVVRHTERGAAVEFTDLDDPVRESLGELASEDARPVSS